MIIVDYIQLMTTGQEGRGGNREQEISNISRSLKSLAKELGIPVVALSQLNRSVETRPNTSKKPQLSDLRESGAIEQDADLVLFIYRPEYYKITEDENGNSTEGKAMIIVGKHRNGATGDIWLRFISTFARFEDLESALMSPDQAASLAPNQNFERTMNTITLPSKINSMSDDGDTLPPDLSF
jgi:replicative DNA helicase